MSRSGQEPFRGALEDLIIDDHPLKAVYEATEYRVGDRFTIRCGLPTPLLDALLLEHGHDAWAYITACNPGSIALDDAANAARMAALTRRLDRLGHPCLPGQGVGAGSDWPPEPSLLVLGIDLAAALALGREFGQVAIVVGRRGEPARLAFCPPGPLESSSLEEPRSE